VESVSGFAKLGEGQRAHSDGSQVPGPASIACARASQAAGLSTRQRPVASVALENRQQRVRAARPQVDVRVRALTARRSILAILPAARRCRVSPRTHCTYAERDFHAPPERGPAQGQTLHPVPSTRSPVGVPEQASSASTTPSWSRSTGSVVVVGRRGVIVDDVLVVLVAGECVVVVVGAYVVDVVASVVVGGVLVDVDVGAVVVVEVVAGSEVVVEEVVVVTCVVDVVVLVDVVVDTETVPRHDAFPTLWPIRLLTTLPNVRSMFASPPARRWQ
jgi:hypothetical protein